MEQLTLHIDASWAAGLLLAITRVGGFVIGSPLVSRAVGMPARLAFTIAIGWFLAAPIDLEVGFASLAAAAVVNAGLGIGLGFLTGLLFHFFSVGGDLVDFTSGLSAAAVIDPTRGERGAQYSSLFNLTALGLFYVTGGLGLIVTGLAWSVNAIPLDGGMHFDGALTGIAAQATGRMLVFGLEVAMPVVAALFVSEVVLGLASRFAPQANVFLLGLPLKLLITLSVSSLSFLLFPEAMDGFMDTMRGTFIDVLNHLGTPPA